MLKDILAGRGPHAMMDMVILNVGMAMFLLEDHMDPGRLHGEGP